MEIPEGPYISVGTEVPTLKNVISRHMSAYFIQMSLKKNVRIQPT